MKSQYKDTQYNLKVEQVFQLINATKNLRDKLIIESCYFPALRRFEVAKMRVEDIDFQEGVINVLGKGSKQSPIPVASVYPQYMSDMKHYLEYIKRKEGYIFSTDGKKPIEISRINQIFNETGIIAKLTNQNKTPKKYYNRITKTIQTTERKINPHLLRHSQARHLKNQNFSAEFIKNYMRHERIDTTIDMYGTMSLDDMKNYAQQKLGIINKVLIV